MNAPHGVPGTRATTDGREVLQGVTDRPTARLRLVDAGDLYVSWVWQHQPHAPRTSVLPRAAVAPALERLQRALPTPIGGETGAEALERALTHGVLLDLEAEQQLAEALTMSLIPQWLGLELNALEAAGLRPHVRVQPSPSTASVPWELIGAAGRTRAIDMFDVSLLLPASLRNDPARVVSPWVPGSRIVAVLDPAVPGAAPDGELGSVLGPVHEGDVLAGMVAVWGERMHGAERMRSADHGAIAAFRRRDLGRGAVAAALSETESPGRFFYVGHVTGSTHALDARMHLADTAQVPGHASAHGPHRPFSAADIALGSPGMPPLRAPNRVALLACDSGGDARFAEPTGLVAAFVHRGAEYVTAARWTLPTDAGLRRFAPTLGQRATGMLAETIAAVDAVHDVPDPVAALAVWQRAQRERWSETGDPRYSPILWGALTTAWAPTPTDPAGRDARD